MIPIFAKEELNDKDTIAQFDTNDFHIEYRYDAGAEDIEHEICHYAIELIQVASSLEEAICNKFSRGMMVDATKSSKESKSG